MRGLASGRRRSASCIAIPIGPEMAEVDPRPRAGRISTLLHEDVVVGGRRAPRLSTSSPTPGTPFSIELGNLALVDSLPGVPAGASFLGTFDREEAVDDERLDFFASGHPLVEGSSPTSRTSPLGRVTVLGVAFGDEKGLGLLALYKDGPIAEAVAVDALGGRARTGPPRCGRGPCARGTRRTHYCASPAGPPPFGGWRRGSTRPAGPPPWPRSSSRPDERTIWGGKGRGRRWSSSCSSVRRPTPCVPRQGRAPDPRPDEPAPREALRAFGRAATQEPAEPDYEFMVGTALPPGRRPRARRRATRRRGAAGPRRPGLRVRPGCAYWHLGRLEEAEATFREGAGRWPDRPRDPQRPRRGARPRGAER